MTIEHDISSGLEDIVVVAHQGIPDGLAAPRVRHDLRTWVGHETSESDSLEVICVDQLLPRHTRDIGRDRSRQCLFIEGGREPKQFDLFWGFNLTNVLDCAIRVAELSGEVVASG